MSAMNPKLAKMLRRRCATSMRLTSQADQLATFVCDLMRGMTPAEFNKVGRMVAQSQREAKASGDNTLRAVTNLAMYGYMTLRQQLADEAQEGRGQRNAGDDPI